MMTTDFDAAGHLGMAEGNLRYHFQTRRGVRGLIERIEEGEGQVVAVG